MSLFLGGELGAFPVSTQLSSLPSKPFAGSLQMSDPTAALGSPSSYNHSFVLKGNPHPFCCSLGDSDCRSMPFLERCRCHFPKATPSFIHAIIHPAHDERTVAPLCPQGEARPQLPGMYWSPRCNESHTLLFALSIYEPVRKFYVSVQHSKRLTIIK